MTSSPHVEAPARSGEDLELATTIKDEATREPLFKGTAGGSLIRSR